MFQDSTVRIRHLNSPSISSEGRSSSKKFYDAVYKLIDHDAQPLKQSDLTNRTFQSHITPFEDQDNHCKKEQSSETYSNGEKIQCLLNNDVFNWHLDQKMRSEGYYQSYPIIKIQFIVSGLISDSYQLQKQDLQVVFHRFGKLDRVLISNNKKVGYALFKSYRAAYVAVKFLDGLKLLKHNIELLLSWLKVQQYQQITIPFKQQYSEFTSAINCLTWQQHQQDMLQLQINQSNNVSNNSYNLTSNQSKIQKQNKLTCRYEIQIENQKDFQVARRIIGTKGCNMKKIIEDSIHKVYTESNNYLNETNINEILKLRLRGRGSGYKQGAEQIQSDDNLHLCVSAKDQKVYFIACQSVEKLLITVYSDYANYTRENGNPQKLSIKKVDMTLQSNPTITKMHSSNSDTSFSNNQNDSLLQNRSRSDSFTSNDTNKDCIRISAARINQLLELRNKARRQLNFLQADRIRNYLRNCGVCLIDQKGRRGRANDVTTWKYLY